MIEGVRILPALKTFHNSMKKEQQKLYKAVQGSLRKIGFDLKNELQNDLRSGQSGSHVFNRLTHIRKMQRSRMRGDKTSPLSKLAYGVRYDVAAQGNKMHLQVGFVGPTSRVAARQLREVFGYGMPDRKVTSKSYIRLAKRQSEGFTQPITEKMRKYFFKQAYDVWKKSAGKKRGRRGNLRDLKSARFLFLRYDTQSFRTPARPIIEPFWIAHRAEVEAKLPIYFRAKMRGQELPGR